MHSCQYTLGNTHTHTRAYKEYNNKQMHGQMTDATCGTPGLIYSRYSTFLLTFTAGSFRISTW